MTKGAKFNRKMCIDFAKILRNAEISEEILLNLGKDLADYFQIHDALFDRTLFLNVLTCSVAYDPKTEKFSGVDENGKVRYPRHVICTCEKRGQS